MAMGSRDEARQQPLFVPVSALAKSPAHPFYARVNELLAEAGFDRFAEERCAPFFASTMGRPSTPPGTYFRMLMIGFFEGISSERGIAWRCADSLALRAFLGCGLEQMPPDHSTLSRTRRLIDLPTHNEVFTFVLTLLGKHGLLKGERIAIDSTSLEANAALRSIVRRDDGTGYAEFLEDLAKASGIETPTREDLARIDKHRPHKGRNDDWQHPQDPDARITKMKDGSTHLAHKLELATDLDTTAIVGVTVQPADRGDTSSMYVTLLEASEQIEQALPDSGGITEAVLDKGFHSNDVLRDLKDMEIRSYVSEPQRGRRRWIGKRDEQAAVYGNRRRIKGEYGKSLLRLRAEIGERAFAHLLETGGLRRVHVRRQINVLKRLLIQACTSNLGLLMRTLTGCGTPRSLQGRAARLFAALCAHLEALVNALGVRASLQSDRQRRDTPIRPQLAAA